ncbi:MAG: AAA family ATPase [Acidimicrobiales bacterium]
MSRPLRSAELSDGQLRFLFLAAALLAPAPPGVIVLNEPESSLHLDLMPSLADLVSLAAERAQVVLTTHAVDLVDLLSKLPGTLTLGLELAGGETIVHERAAAS